MAENSKGGIFAKAQKRLTRTKTKVLQNLGRADRTQDETFDECVTRIERQQEVAHRIQKELKNYIHCVRALSLASRSFYSAVSESYEPDWTKEEDFRQNVQSLDLLWGDYLQKLHEKSLEPVNLYIYSFPALKARVSKRGRKQVDYDNARHNLEVLQNAKKKDEAKIQKAQEELDEAKKIYEDLNNELHAELPDFYNSRVTFYGNVYQNLFGAENIFHQEVGRVSENVCDITTQLCKDNEQYIYKPKRPLSKSFSDGFEENHVNGQHSPDELANMSTSQGFSLSTANTPAKPDTEQAQGQKADEHPQDNVYSNQEAVAQHEAKHAEAAAAAEAVADVEAVSSSAPTTPTTTPTTEQSVKEDDKKQSEPEVKVNGDVSAGHSDDSEDQQQEPAPLDVPDYPPPQPPADSGVKKEEDTTETRVVEDGVYDEPKPIASKRENVVKDSDTTDYETPPSNKPLKEPPPDVLFVVQSTHPYQNEDKDELSFEAGEMIYVIKFDNPEEQDDGWLMGIKQCDRTRGVFPENFTKRLGQDG